MIIEVVGGVLVMGLAVATTFAALVGVLGIVGVVRFFRCDHCGRLGIAPASEPVPSCAYCRHSRLAHPVYTLRTRHRQHEARG